VRQAPAKTAANKEKGTEGLTREGRLKYPSSPVCDLAWMPQYSEHLAHPVVVAVAKAMLDDHIRIAQFNYRAIGALRYAHTTSVHDSDACGRRPEPGRAARGPTPQALAGVAH
jgi:hypothetical protein